MCQMLLMVYNIIILLVNTIIYETELFSQMLDEGSKLFVLQ